MPCKNPSLTTLSRKVILFGTEGCHSRASTTRAPYVALNKGKESSISVTGGSDDRFGMRAVHMTSARPVLARVELSIRARTCERIIVARARTFAYGESIRIRMGGKSICQLA